MSYRRKSKRVMMQAHYDEDGILSLEALENIYPLIAGDIVTISDEVIR